MKTKNKDNRSTRRALATLAALIAVTAVGIAAVLAYNKLHDLWIEQCVITDVVRQVRIETGNRTMPDTIREMFGLRNGANLALIDFSAKREAALKKYPSIKSIGISRRLPDGVTITVIEREPIARLGLSGSKKETGRVCDDEGVVFIRRRGAEMLPIIREPSASETAPGSRLENRARAALGVLLVVREAEFANLNLLEIDTARLDYLLFTFTNYSQVKFRWDGLDSETPESNANMRDQLTRVWQAIGTNLSGDVNMWNATIQGTVTSSGNRHN